MKPTRFHGSIGLLLAGAMLLTPLAGMAGPRNPDTNWFKDAKLGVFMHFLPDDEAGFTQLNAFDVEAVARQLHALGVKYFFITLGQNSGYYISPNTAYDRYTGYAAGRRCAVRDLPLDLERTLRPRGIRLMLYLPCQAPNGDPLAQKAFGLVQGPRDQKIDLAFAHKWAEVIQEWSDRYGDKVAGWWFDGGYRHVGFNDGIARTYAAAAKHGNPHSIVTFNPGVKVIHYNNVEDYTAGEINDLNATPSGRWLDGSQWHALTYAGATWGRRDTRLTDARWIEWLKAVTDKEGVVTLDMGPNWNPREGPIGSFSNEQMRQVRAMTRAILKK